MRDAFRRRALPYLLSLPALLVCIGILIPFGTAIYYSLQRYRLNLPHLRKMNWGENYLKFLTDSEFWNTLQVSLAYTGLTVGLELLLGSASRSCCSARPGSTTSSPSCSSCRS